jgi:hypothetical protein
MPRDPYGGVPLGVECAWRPGAPDDSDFQGFSHGDFIGAPAASRPLGNA